MLPLVPVIVGIATKSVAEIVNPEVTIVRVAVKLPVPLVRVEFPGRVTPVVFEAVKNTVPV